MRKLLTLSALLFCVFISRAQVTNEQRAAALQLVNANRTAIGLSSTDLSDVIVSAAYQVAGTDVIMVYLQQSYVGIPVYNQLQVLAFKNGQLVSNAGNRLANMEKLTGGANEIPAVSAVQAVRSAFVERNIVEKELPVPVSNSAEGHQFEFGRLGVATESIKTELIWMPGKDNRVRLAWQVQLAPNASPDLWLIRIDAKSGTYIDKTNLTITCNWDDTKHSLESHLAETLFNNDFSGVIRKQNNTDWQYRPFAVTDANYTVIKYPAESPQHTGGTPSVHNKPWLLTPGNATSLGWHNDGTVIHDSTRGNNVWAQEDRDNNDNTAGKATISGTGQPTLDFSNVYNFTLAPTEATLNNQKAAVTNLFYWNNLLHDLSYAYGFDEVAGNFQNSNQGRGGAGADYVVADAQDAGGTNNANMSVPADGTRARMQMYLFTSTSPQRDGDLDNGVISHEYTHGISVRMTGGPANSSCLDNAEQGGEGWSDYFALMMTTNWATATVNDGPLARPMGTYVLGQPVTGGGIRTHPYSTNMAINPLTYSFVQSSGGEVHDIGELWCVALWEMTWEIIKQDNAINSNLFVPGPVASMTGNSAALKLVVEGMRLQPCSPGFLDARNAILRADTLFFNKKYSCAIWKAFAKRGMGRNASQGSSNSTSDQVVDFTTDASALTVTTNAASVPETQNIVYTNNVTAGDCVPVTNFLLTDTLPANVTYISGGSYNPANRVVSFSPVTVAAGSNQSYILTVKVNANTYFPATTVLDEPVAGATIPGNWTETSTTGTHWTVSTTQRHSVPYSFFSPEIGSVSDQIIATTGSFALGATPSPLTFWHSYNTEGTFDGAVVEISTNGGGTWSDIGAANFMSNGYNGNITTGFSSPISGRPAFSGNSGGFIKSVVDLTLYAFQQNCRIRFRFASDISVSGIGWYVDDIEIKTASVINMRTSLFGASGSRVSTADNSTAILPANGCAGPTVGIITQPVCAQSTGSVVLNDLPATGAWVINPGNISGAGTSKTVPGLGAGTYNFTVTDAGGCTSAPSANVVINPSSASPTVDAINNQVVCANGTTAAINFTGSVAGTAFNWTNNNALIGLAGTGSGNIPAFAALNAGITPLTSTITVNPSVGGYAYISNYSSNNISVINTLTSTVTATIPVGTNPYGVSASPDGSRIYVTNFTSNNVYVINTLTNSVVATIAVGTNPIGVVVSPDGGRVYVGNYGSNSISVINTASNAVVATIGVGPNPEGIVISPDGSRVFVAILSANSVSVINTATNSVVATIAVGSGPVGMSISPDGSRVYVSNYLSSNVSVINTATNAVIAAVTVGSLNYCVALSPDGSRLYAANGGSNSVSVVNTVTNAVIATIPIGAAPRGISISADGGKVYAINSVSNSVSVINAATNAVSATIIVGSNPFAFGNFIAAGAVACAGTPKTFTITANPSPTVTAPTITQPSCGTPAGTILVNATAGAGTVEYSIDNGSNWQLSAMFSNLVAGSYNIRARVQGSTCTTAYAGNPVVLNTAACNTKTIPGRVEAESFDAKSGGMYSVPTTDAGGGQQVIGINNGGWMDYNVNVLASGSYTVNFRIATSQNSAQFQIRSGTSLLATVNFPNTGDWNNWVTVPVSNVPLTAGLQTIRIQSSNNESCNFNWMDWSLTSGSIIVTANLNSFTTCGGTPSAEQAGSVTATGLTANLVITAPTGFEISTVSGNGFGSSVTLVPAGGTVTATTLYIRMSSVVTGTPSGNITFASTGNTTTSLAVNGTVNPLTLIVTNNADSGPGSLRQAVSDACPGTTITFSGVTGPISLSSGRILIAKNLTIQGPGANLLTVQNTKAPSGTSYVFLINSGVTATISGLTISGGNINVSNTGGAITDFGYLTVINSIISNNLGSSVYAAPNGSNYYGGGAIFIKSGNLNLTNSVISGNIAPDGGGIYNVDGTINLNGSVISGNSATIGSFGGGIFATGSGSIINLINSTISNNQITGNQGGGGGIYSSNSSTLNMTNSTISGNISTPVSGSGGIWNNGGTVNARNTIIAGNTASAAPDFSGAVISAGFNLVGKSDGSSGFTQATDLKGTITVPLDPLLGPLQNNGGATMTHALLTGSPAIDKGSAVAGMATDQRGAVRPYDDPSVTNAVGGNGSDIGAYEAGQGTAPIANAGPNQTIILPLNQVTMAGSGASNNGGSISSHTWSKLSGGAAVITNPNNYTTTITGLAAGTYIFRLMVIQDDNQSAFSDVTITVNPGAPTASAGPSQTIALPVNQVTLAGSGASGSGGTLTAHTWTKFSGGAATITDPSNYGTTVTGLSIGIYVFRLTVFQNDNQSATSDVTITVNNAAPTAIAGPPQTITLPTNQVTLNGSGTGLAGNGLYDGLLTKVDKKGNVVWSKAVGGNANEILYKIKKTADNGFIAVGQTKSYGNSAGDAWLVKLDATGSVQWSKKYGDGNILGEEGRDVVQLGDGGYALCGSHHFAAGASEGFVVRTDNQGNVIWSKQYGKAGSDQLPSLVEDGNSLVVTGFYQGASFYDGYVMKLDKANGSVQWIKGLDAENRSTWCGGINKTNNGYQIYSVITDNYTDQNQQECIWNLDVNGTIQNVRKLVIPGTWSISYGWQTLPDGGFAAVNSSNVSSDLIFCQVNANGSLDWSKKFVRSGKQQISGITPSAEGGYAAVGYNNNPAGVADSNNIYMIRVDNAGDAGICSGITTGELTVVTPSFTTPVPDIADLGNVVINNPVITAGVINVVPEINTFCSKDSLFQKTYGGTKDESALDLVATADSGYIIAGQTNSFGNGGTITYAWTRISGPNNAPDLNIVSPASATTVITGLIQGTYVFRLTVTQSDGQSASSDVTITVNPAATDGKTIPGKIEAENFDVKHGGMYAVPTTDAGGGQQVIGISDGSWMEYNVNVLTTGTYTINFRVATSQNNAQFRIKTNGTLIGTIHIPNTGGWDNWQTGPVNNIALTAGFQTIRIESSSTESCNLNWTNWVLEGGGGNLPPTVVAGPNQIITLPANQVTLAGSGTANNGGTITAHVWSKESGGAANITDVNNYGTTVTGLSAGTYVFRLTVTQSDNQTASSDVMITVNAAPGPTATAGPNQVITLPTSQVTLAGSGTANNGGTITAHVWSKQSGGSANITDVNNYATTVTGLSAGTYIFRLTVTQNDNQTSTSDVTITVNPAGGNGKFIPGKIEAESFDSKQGGMYSVPTGDAGGGQQVIGISNGSWMDYNVTVTQAGTYTVSFRVATTQNSAQLQITLGGNILGTISIPNTGGWDNWQTVTVNNIQLPNTGAQTIRIQSGSNESCNFNWMDWLISTPLMATINKAPERKTYSSADRDKQGTTTSGLQVLVFPNPANDHFNLKVQSKSSEPVVVRITDIAGRQVQQLLRVMPGQTIQFGDHLLGGTYLVELSQGSERVITKLIKQ